MQDTDFTGKNVLVVGGSSGIGNGIAQAFRARGANVEIWGTRQSAEDYAGEEGSDLSGLTYQQVDVGSPDAIAAATLSFQTLDVLVLSQGIVAYKKAEFSQPGWDQVMSVNLDSLIHCCEKFRSDLAAQNGSIIIISSVSGIRANIGNPAYAASKAGAISLTKTLGQAYARDGIRVMVWRRDWLKPSSPKSPRSIQTVFKAPCAASRNGELDNPRRSRAASSFWHLRWRLMSAGKRFLSMAG